MAFFLHSWRWLLRAATGILILAGLGAVRRSVVWQRWAMGLADIPSEQMTLAEWLTLQPQSLGDAAGP